MKRLAIRLIAVLLTFLIGTAATSAWFIFRRLPVQSNKLLSGPPCREGVVSVEPQHGVPLLIKISEAACDNPQVASVHFVVENISSKPISKYNIRSIETYERFLNDGSGVIEGGILQPRQTRRGFLGGGVMQVGELKSYKLAVWSVTFTDGTTWTRTSQ
jgi:hypothetical protein